MLQRITKHVPQLFECKECKKEFRSTLQMVEDKGKYCPECYKKKIAKLQIVLMPTRTPLEEKILSDIKNLSFDDIKICHKEVVTNFFACAFHKHRTEIIDKAEEKWSEIVQFLTKVMQHKALAEGRK